MIRYICKHLGVLKKFHMKNAAQGSMFQISIHLKLLKKIGNAIFLVCNLNSQNQKSRHTGIPFKLNSIKKLGTPLQF